MARADAFLSPGLGDLAASAPHGSVRVIVQGVAGCKKSMAVGADVRDVVANDPGNSNGLGRRLVSVDGVAAQLSGKQIVKLARKKCIEAITVDAPVRLTSEFTNRQRWAYASQVSRLWSHLSSDGSGVQAPTIAIVDSGIEAGRADFGSRVLRQVDLTSLPNNSPGDGRGHGTFVASIAAGAGADYAGAVPNAKLVSIDVIDDSGVGLTSDVIAAADWILQNKNTYGIRVANFSLHGSQPSTFRFDPLNRAVERLWFSGVVVVAAAGNYGAAQSGVLYAPANDPFVITVGAVDLDGSVGVSDDYAAPWSAYGYTLDGFAKPELAAPGRYIVGAVPANSTLVQERPDRVVDTNHLLMSGTSFAAPIVSGAAAYILAMHPTFTPDQVKGALMLTARRLPDAVPLSVGVGELAAADAAAVSNPPNPNLALNQFVGPDPVGGSAPVFDQATWTSAAQNNPIWDAATWTSATWTSATWTSATWTSATWTSATWTSATWTSATWISATWTSSTDATWTSSSESEANASDGEWSDPQELAGADDEHVVDPNP